MRITGSTEANAAKIVGGWKSGGLTYADIAAKVKAGELPTANEFRDAFYELYVEDNAGNRAYLTDVCMQHAAGHVR